MKMSDAELSLAVAKIMWPEYEWESTGTIEDAEDAFAYEHDVCVKGFNYTEDDAGMKMCVWLAKKVHCKANKLARYGWGTDIESLLISDSPHRAIAEAIIEASHE